MVQRDVSSCMWLTTLHYLQGAETRARPRGPLAQVGGALADQCKEGGHLPRLHQPRGKELNWHHCRSNFACKRGTVLLVLMSMGATDIEAFHIYSEIAIAEKKFGVYLPPPPPEYVRYLEM